MIVAEVYINGNVVCRFPVKGFPMDEGGFADSLTNLDIAVSEYDRIQMALVVSDGDGGGGLPPIDGGDGGSAIAAIGDGGSDFTLDPGPGTQEMAYDAATEYALTFTLQLGAVDEEQYQR